MPEPPAGLRERKKQRTRAAIQKEALRLFLKQGFATTTIEDVAAAAEISPSTFFNYFPSKEAVVFEDELDPLILAAFEAQPKGAHPVRALRAAMRTVFSELSADQERLMLQRVQLMATTPELRAAMLNQFSELVDQIGDVLASRVGRPRNDFALHNVAGAVLGVLMSVMIAMAEKPSRDMVELADSALAHLEAGLPLDWPSPA